MITAVMHSLSGSRLLTWSAPRHGDLVCTPQLGVLMALAQHGGLAALVWHDMMTWYVWVRRDDLVALAQHGVEVGVGMAGTSLILPGAAPALGAQP